MYLKPIAKGLLTYVPGLMALARRRTAGSDSARYCYTVWMRHLSKLAAAGLNSDPRVVAELGPGDSLGMGLAALLTGADALFALDVERFAAVDRNLRVFDQLVDLFRARAPIPGDSEFPNVRPQLSDYSFPSALLDEARLTRTLAPARIDAIRAALKGEPSTIRIVYQVPWDQVIADGTVDLVYSQAVLEHVADLDATCAAMARWLVPGGASSHTIDFESHNITPQWDGHRQYPPAIWKLVLGKRTFLINREPLSVQKAFLQKSFAIHSVEAYRKPPQLAHHQLASCFRGLSAEDLETSGAFVLATKPL